MLKSQISDNDSRQHSLKMQHASVVNALMASTHELEQEKEALSERVR